MRLIRFLPTSVGLAITSAAVIFAQPDQIPAPDVPTPAEQQHAAIEMLFTMLAALAVIVILLRTVAKSQQRKQEKPEGETAFDKVRRHFENK
jgi:hypothetical protein